MSDYPPRRITSRDLRRTPWEIINGESDSPELSEGSDPCPGGQTGIWLKTIKMNK